MDQKYLKYIQLINQYFFLPSHAMIKVHSVFPNNDPRREIAVQTEPLPKIRHLQGRGKAQSPTHDHHLPLCGGEVIKNSSLGPLCDPSWRATSYGAFKTHNQAPRYQRDRKQNTCSSLETSKLQAKSFRFLTFEENLLKSAILKHLEGRVLSRNERKKMEEIINITFVTKQSRQDRFRGMFQTDDLDIIEVPQHEKVSASIMEIVDGIRAAYSKLNLHSKEKDLLLGNTNRKILHTVESIICKGVNIQICEPMITEWQKQQILSNYLFRYVKKSEFKESYFNTQDTKKQLMNFYQEIYNRYEATPFNEQSLSQEDDAPLPKVNKNTLKPSKNCTSNKQFCTSDESFIKLRFYNNLRKQVKTLGEDAEKIISNEMNKLGQA